MRRTVLVVGFVVAAYGANAQTIVFKTDTLKPTTGEAIEGTYNLAVSTNVPEITGLLITARTDSPNHEINADSDSLGINDASTSSDKPARFEANEILIISFNQAVEITQFDFRYFDSGETFHVAVDGQPDFLIEYESLSDKISDFINTNLVVAANTAMAFYATGTDQIGLEGIDLNVVGGTGELMLSFSTSNGTAHVSADFDGAATTNYVLQSCTNLASNDWTTVSAPFAFDTDLQIESTNNAGFYRAIAQ